MLFPTKQPHKKRLKTHDRKKEKTKTKQRLKMTDTARPPPMSEIPPVSPASAALKINSGGGGGGPDDVVAVAALIDELKVRFDYLFLFDRFLFFPDGSLLLTRNDLMCLLLLTTSCFISLSLSLSSLLSSVGRRAIAPEFHQPFIDDCRRVRPGTNEERIGPFFSGHE